MNYSQALTDDEYESSNIASQKEVFLVISHYGAIPICQLPNIQCMHGPHIIVTDTKIKECNRNNR